MRVVLSLLAAVAALVVATPAGAAVTSSFNGGNARIDVALSASGDQATVLVVTGGAGDPQIHVNGVWPTGATVSSTQSIVISSSAANTVAVIDLRGGLFEPGISPGAFHEIGFTVSGPAGQNELRIVTGDGAQTIALGGTAINLNAQETSDVDSDVSLFGLELVTVQAGLGADTLTAAGGAGVGMAPFSLPVALSGGGGNDVVRGGSDDDTVTGGAGVDILAGGDGDDVIAARDGAADDIDCGAGQDGADADRADTRVGCEIPLLGGKPVVGTTVKTRWRLVGATTRVLELTAKHLPAGAKVRVACAGGTCPFRQKTKTYVTSKAAVGYANLFGTRKLNAGVVITLRVTAPGRAGRIFSWELRKRKLPRLTSKCLAPGSTTPVACP